MHTRTMTFTYYLRPSLENKPQKKRTWASFVQYKVTDTENSV